MLSGYAHDGFTEEALRLFNDMLRLGVRPNETTRVLSVVIFPWLIHW